MEHFTYVNCSSRGNFLKEAFPDSALHPSLDIVLLIYVLTTPYSFLLVAYN